MSDLPTSWITSQMGEIADVVGGGTPKACDPSNFTDETTGYPWLTPADLSGNKKVYVNGGKRYLSEKGLRNSSAVLVPKGTVLFTSRAPIGYVAVAARSLATNQGFRSFVCRNQIVPDYVYYYLKTAKGMAEQLASGTTFLEISGSRIKEIPIPIAPSNEQRRIVEKLDKLNPKVQRCQERLEQVAKILKRFRQSVLAAACSGRLTADWRETKAVVLNDGEHNADEFPAGWKPACIGDVIESLKYGTSQKCDYKKCGVPVLRIPNVVRGTIDHSDLKYADLPKKELEQLRLYAGDILLIRSNGSVSLVGKCALVREAERGFAYAGYLLRLRPDRTLMQPEFLSLVLGSFDIRLQIELEARSTSGVNNINGEEVRALRVMLPPLPEQEEIVHRVEALFNLADQIEARYQKAKASVDKLTQSLLAKAFRGELVPQDPNDESASVLLERIKNERESRGTAPKVKRLPPRKRKIQEVANG